MRRLILTAMVTAAVAAGLVLGASPAAAAREAPEADGGPGVYNWANPLPMPGEVGVEVGTYLLERESGDGGVGEPSPCGYVPVDDPEIIQTFQAEHPGEDGAVYVSFCYIDGTSRNFGVYWYPQVTPEELALQAVQRMALPAPDVGVNPPVGSPQLVGALETWLWVEPASWVPVVAAASVPGVSATVTATPRTVTWDMGDGAQVRCDGPGEPYDPDQATSDQIPECGHTYRRSSATQPGGAYAVTTTVTYDVTWEAVGAPGGGPLPPITSTAELSLPVAEVQALN